VLFISSTLSFITIIFPYSFIFFPNKKDVVFEPSVKYCKRKKRKEKKRKEKGIRNEENGNIAIYVGTVQKKGKEKEMRKCL